MFQWVSNINTADFIIVVRVWVRRHEAMQVHFDLNRAIKDDFQRDPPVIERAQAAE